MSLAPMNLPVDNAAGSWLIDPVPARIWVLSEVLHRQHALATAWGGIGHYHSCRLIEGDSVDIHVTVPPGVTEMDFSLFVTGYGKVTLTSAADTAAGEAGSIREWIGSDQFKGPVDVFEVATNGDIPSGAANTGRALTVAASSTWVAKTDLVNIAVDAASDTVVWGIRTRPIHVAR